MVIFDTNAILRYILQDNIEMADLVDNEIISNTCYIPNEVIAEMVYVLRKVYRIERKRIALTVKGILKIENISTFDNDIV